MTRLIPCAPERFPTLFLLRCTRSQINLRIQLLVPAKLSSQPLPCPNSTIDSIFYTLLYSVRCVPYTFEITTQFNNHQRHSQVRVHASSVNTSAQESEGDTCTVAIFEEVTRNDAFLYVTACTLLRPHFLPLVAAHLVVAEEPQASALNLRYYAEISFDSTRCM